MGLYISDEDVKVRLIGKVRFTDDMEEKGKMHILLLRRLISEAEGEVEYDLSPRYEAPFVTIDGGRFQSLPDRPTRNILRMLCELKACIRVIETDFGSGTAVSGDKYAEVLKKRYDSMLKQLIQRKGGEDDEQTGWKYPPLPGLKLAYFNMAADDGFAGMVLSTSSGDGSYPHAQINDPSENWINGLPDDLG